MSMKINGKKVAIKIQGSPSAGIAGVASFKKRTGDVVPLAGDYTADMVGAISSSDVKSIRALTEQEFDALETTDPAIMYVVYSAEG